MEDQGSTALGQKGQYQPLGRKQSGHDAHVGERLNAQPQADPLGYIATAQVVTTLGDAPPGKEQPQVCEYQRYRAQQAPFLAQNRQYIVTLGFR